MSEPTMVAVVVDQEACIGSGQCELLEEQTFYVDDDTAVAGVVGTGMLPLERAEIVIDRCPASAISIIESGETGSDTDASEAGD